MLLGYHGRVQLPDLVVFVTVARERSFSRAAKLLHRTQPAISQAVKRLEDELSDRLFDRSARDGALTESGRLLLDYADRILRTAGDATAAIRELQHLRRGRVVIGANEAAVHSLLPLLARFVTTHPDVNVEVRRVPSRQMTAAILDRSLDIGVLTFQPADRGLQSIMLGQDELVKLAHPEHALAGRKRVSIQEVGRQAVIAHNDPSPARERVLRLYERRHAPINIRVSLPSLDGIKRAVEMGLGIAVLPRRCALAEIAAGRLAAVKIPELSSPRTVRIVFRRGAELSHAAEAFLDIARGG
jgi:DNA-binding transcriptional LysR family regulator